MAGTKPAAPPDTMHQSPISPGLSFYEAQLQAEGIERPRYAPLDGDRHADVAIVGGGFTGLSCALTLAEAGADVVLLEASRVGDGASGRNGGQMGTGPRDGVLALEAEVGRERARALWDIAEGAKRTLRETAERYQFGIDHVPGQLDVLHKASHEREARAGIDALNERYDYPHIHWHDPDDMAERVGSRRYHGGSRDTGTGHIQPMKYVVGLARAADQVGAQLCEDTPVTKVTMNGTIRLETPRGTVTASKVLLALNGTHGDLHPALAAHVLPIQSFIGATAPLPDDTDVLPGFEAVADTRFMVRYFRKTRDNRLLFGGREAYGRATPADIERQIRAQIAEVYPQLADEPLTHAWGGSVGITTPRLPYVRELEPGLWTAGGYSGHGVMMSNHTGRLVAEMFLGESETLRHLAALDVPAFPGGRHLREPIKVAALTWFSLLDRL